MHSFESYLLPKPNQITGADPPSSDLPMGHQLHLILHDYDIPRHAYTLDIVKHAPEIVAAYKKLADVCLHPSKVEGFGMNVIECQAAGTPVITTNYTAMADYTSFGRAVPHLQMIKTPGELYEMALPNVNEIADALGELYKEHLALKRGEKEALSGREAAIARTDDWMDETFSSQAVLDKFTGLFVRAQNEFSARQEAKQELMRGNPPKFGAYQIATGYHSTVVDWDAPWTLFAPDGLTITNEDGLNHFLWVTSLVKDDSKPSPLVMILPAVYDDGSPVPVVTPEYDIHVDQPVIMRTFMAAALQGQASRRSSLLRLAVQASQPQSLPDGLAVVERKKKVEKGDFWGQFSKTEL